MVLWVRANWLGLFSTLDLESSWNFDDSCTNKLDWYILVNTTVRPCEEEIDRIGIGIGVGVEDDKR